MNVGKTYQVPAAAPGALCETGACVCHLFSTNMRLVGIETHPFPNVGVDLFTYECVCGELHTDTIRLQERSGLMPINVEVNVRHSFAAQARAPS